MRCRDCQLWDKENQKCRSGKVNPKRKEDALIMVQLTGIRALCVFNPFREELLNNRAAAPPPASSTARKRRPHRRFPRG